MKFVLDQSADAGLIPHLRRLGHDATRIAKEYPHGLPDARVLDIAYSEGRVLITADLDFGDLVFRQRLPHAGVILFRLGDFAELTLWVARLDHVLAAYGDRLDQIHRRHPSRCPGPPALTGVRRRHVCQNDIGLHPTLRVARAGSR